MDDEMADEDQDYDELDANQLGGPAYPPPLPATDATTQTHAHIPPYIPVPPPQHYPNTSGGHLNMTGSHPLPQIPANPQFGGMGHLGFSALPSNQPATGAPPLSTHGFTQASMAPVGLGAMPVNGPSTASMHQQPHYDGGAVEDPDYPPAN